MKINLEVIGKNKKCLEHSTKIPSPQENCYYWTHLDAPRKSPFIRTYLYFTSLTTHSVLIIISPVHFSTSGWQFFNTMPEAMMPFGPNMRLAKIT
jgi:hypothetical protein